MADEILKNLCSSAKLDRDKGVRLVDDFLKQADDDQIVQLSTDIQKLLENAESPWESKHGGLMASKSLLSNDRCRNKNPDFSDNALSAALLLLEDGEVMGTLCQTTGASVYAHCKYKILSGIRDNLERKPVSALDESQQKEAAKLAEKLAISDSSSGSESDDSFELRRTTSAEQIFHDTAGWKSLETWMKCLQCMIEGCGCGFNSYIDQPLLDLIKETLTHTNRFVRETGFYVCSALVGCNYSKEGEMLVPLEENMIYVHGKEFSEHLARGVADNWSQVRLAASNAARSFLVGLQSDDIRSKFYSVLLPPLCLNRYYVAEGVRIYNQQTWKQVTEGRGKDLVEKYIDDMVKFYVSQSEADNHAVREAACACIAELGSKVNKDAVRPHIKQLLDALLVCFRDDSWPVRDASCVACGNFVHCFPEESKESMPSLYPLFYDNLQDNIPSVREGAALALANVVRAYGEEAMKEVLEKLKEGLKGVENQAENVDKYSSLEKGPATYGVVKRARDNDMDLHENNPMYSCGSLAPKMGRGKRGGGCMDHQFKRPSEPWERADGCVHMMAELAQIPSCTQEVTKLLPTLAAASSHKHYTQHLNFLETLAKRLPSICNGVGKRVFKSYIEMFFDPIFYAAGCDNQLTSSAAQQCLAELTQILGPNILRGRVEQHDPRYLDLLPPAGHGPGVGAGMFPPGARAPGMPVSAMPGYPGSPSVALGSKAPWASMGSADISAKIPPKS